MFRMALSFAPSLLIPWKVDPLNISRIVHISSLGGFGWILMEKWSVTIKGGSKKPGHKITHGGFSIQQGERRFCKILLWETLRTKDPTWKAGTATLVAFTLRSPQMMKVGVVMLID